MARRQARSPREQSGLWEVVDLRIVLSLAGGLLLAVAIAWGARWIMDPQTLPLRAIEVEGDFNKVDAQQIQDALKGVDLGGLFSVDVAQVRRLAEALPWVEHVSVSRKWPDTLKLNVFEHKAVAEWGQNALLDSKAQVFVPGRSSFPADLPVLYGPAGQEAAVLHAYQDMSRLVNSVGLGIKQLDMDARRAWRVELNNGIELRLGRVDREQQILRFVHVYPKVLADKAGRIKRIDLRYTNGFAVQWKHGGSAAAWETANV